MIQSLNDSMIQFLEGRGTGRDLDKKIGVSNSDSRRHFQPRLPGSVVGDASMDLRGRGNKITEDNDL